MAVTSMATSGLVLNAKYKTMSADFGNAPFLAEYVVIAGGAGGGNGGNLGRDGAGGAGGYRSSVVGEMSGGGVSAEQRPLLSGTYAVVVGAGGAGRSNGSNSLFASVLCIGGGTGGAGGSGINGNAGGSGGGESGSGLSAETGDRAAGVAGQGFRGGAGNGSDQGGSGGGAGAEGANAGTTGQAAGVASSITGSSVTRALGGSRAVSYSGPANTGNGAGSAGNGGSGVVIFRVPIQAVVTFSAGVTHTSSIVGLNRVYTVTATSTTSETVTIL